MILRKQGWFDIYYQINDNLAIIKYLTHPYCGEYAVSLFIDGALFAHTPFHLLKTHGVDFFKIHNGRVPSDYLDQYISTYTKFSKLINFT